MKIGIIGDLHLGFTSTKSGITHAVTKGQHDLIESMIQDFEARGITDLVFLGDIFEVRPVISCEVLHYAYMMFRDRLAKFNCRVIAGNHDMLFDNSSEICQIRYFENLPNVTVFIDSVGMEKIGGKKWFFVPWIQESKMQSVTNWLIKTGRGDNEQNVIVGHFDMIGAQMEAKTVSKAGIDPKHFLNAAKVTFSGHYHCKSEISDGTNSIYYVGTPYQMSFGHVGVKAGYHIFDTETETVEFVENNISPEFIEVKDTELDTVGDLSNKIVKYFSDNGRNYDEAAKLKGQLVSLHPIYIETVTVGEDPTETEDTDAPKTEEEARQLLTTDALGMAAMYLDKHPEILPELASGEDARTVTLNYIKEYNSKIK